MTAAKLKSILKKIVSSWWFTPAIGFGSLAMSLLLPHTGFAKTIENMLYPESGWVGAVSFRLNDVPGYSSKRDLDLILLSHHLGESSRVTFLRDGSTPEFVIAGAPAVSLVVEQAKPRTSGLPLFDVDLPSATLVATGVSGVRGGPPSRYTIATTQFTKSVDGKGDLVVMTRNELLHTRIAYGLSFLALGLAAIFMPRYARLIHPEGPE